MTPMSKNPVSAGVGPSRPRVYWLQHAEHEGLGCIGPWLEKMGYAVTCTRLFAGETLPPVQAFDWLMVMGGPMNIYQHAQYPWLEAEKRLINDALVINKKVLGICLGAQLIADVLGAKISKNKNTEIGFFDVYLTDNTYKYKIFIDFPINFPAFHWHGDTFAIPPGTENLIKSDACVNQAFVWRDRAIAIQFHLEVTLDDARRWLELEDLKPERYVQTATEILRDPARFELNNRLMIRLLERMAAINPPAAEPPMILRAGLSGGGEIAGGPPTARDKQHR